MGGEKDSELIRLIRGEGGSLWPSRGERRMLKFALDSFGEHLSRFLLSGLGEEEESRIWLFTVMFTNDKGALYRRDIRVEVDDLPDIITLLPCRREPLVMLALLHLLLEAHGPSASTLSYSQEQVLNLLGWEDDEASRSTIDQAVRKYPRLSYSWGLSREELAERKLSFYDTEGRFISGYGFYNAEKDGEDRRVENSVDFSSVFVEGLMRRREFGVDWNRVSEITREVVR